LVQPRESARSLRPPFGAMGTGASAGLQAGIQASSEEDLRKVIAAIGAEDRKKLTQALASLDSEGAKAAPAPAGEMRAWRAHAYGASGSPDDTIGKMTLESVPVPQPKAGQVLVKVEAASVNPIDWKLFSGGLDAIAPTTFPYTPGFDIAGTVEALGDGVEGLSVGDKVCGDIGLVESCKKDTEFGPGGAFAEFAVLPANFVAKRGSLPASDAAALPLAALTVYQALFTGAGRSFEGEELGKLEAGQKLLVLGGATATGIYAIQLAKNAGAVVATTASSNKMPDGTSKLEVVKAMGAEIVIDYKEKDWSEELAGKDYDLILDCVGTEADWPKASKVLKKGAKFVSIANFTSPASTKDHKFQIFLVKSTVEDLNKLVALANDGKLRVLSDSKVKFEDVPAALKKSMGGGAAGKIIIEVCTGTSAASK